MGDEDGVFAMTGDGAVAHLDGPVVVFIDIVGWAAEARHWFDTDSIAFDEFVAVAFFTVIRNFGGIVHFLVDAVTNVIFNNAEVAFAKDSLYATPGATCSIPSHNDDSETEIIFLTAGEPSPPTSMVKAESV